MRLKALFLNTLFILLLRAGFAQKTDTDTAGCEVGIPTWFDPGCYIDTCMGGPFGAYFSGNCLIEKVRYRIYDQKGENVIYEADEAWDAIKTWDGTNPVYYELGYYPYELTFYKKDKTSFKRKGRILLLIW